MVCLVRYTSGGICLCSPKIYCSAVLVVVVVHRKEVLSAVIQVVNQAMNTQSCHSKCVIDEYEEFSSTIGWENLMELKAQKTLQMKMYTHQYRHETWEDENDGNDKNIEEQLGKISTNPK